MRQTFIPLQPGDWGGQSAFVVQCAVQCGPFALKLKQMGNAVGHVAPVMHASAKPPAPPSGPSDVPPSCGPPPSPGPVPPPSPSVTPESCEDEPLSGELPSDEDDPSDDAPPSSPL
jgi:hypothetical protein